MDTRGTKQAGAGEQPLTISASERVKKIMQERFPGMKLIVASNREPYQHRRVGQEVRCERAMGGLVAALDPVIQAMGGAWIAWGDGDADRDTANRKGEILVPPNQKAYTLRRIWLTDEEAKCYYAGYSNQFLWPLCHMALDRMVFKNRYWEYYKEVNRKFAEAVLGQVSDHSSLVWIQDYHLALCPRYIKQKSPDQSVSLFWHIPWPAPDVFRICPQRKDLLEGLLSCDLLGFHLERYCTNFMDCVEQETDARVNRQKGIIRYRDRQTKIKAFPISVDYEQFQILASLPGATQRVANIRKKLKLPENRRIGLGVDRLDYTKGLLKRLWALDNFFQRFKQYQGRFTFIQMAVPTREESKSYRSYRELIQATVDEINGKYARDDWRPIEHLEGKLNHEVLSAYYRAADLCIVGSVYDGMNLVAKEYIASQSDENGALLLSELAGAAEEIDGAILINPYDTESFADAIRMALELPDRERWQRMQRMKKHLREHDIYHWVESVLREAAGVRSTR